ncbi:hypothetical protein BC937DRAFT_93445 [Endogone sp. FLAS-F59071]|nr:hypothetical protein BC937DRAFT_93445 [Endogone sp. FLAS-F59071]|eukprot:RUS21160.1 hypothetical protein BC937DRAFT_93445 [Endogone sp. FLAS-F59071]
MGQFFSSIVNDITSTTKSTDSYESQHPSGFQHLYVPQTRVQPLVYDSVLGRWRRNDETTSRTLSTRLSYIDSDDDDVSTNIYQRRDSNVYNPHDRFEYGNDTYGRNSNATSSLNLGSIHRNSQPISYGYYDSDDDVLYPRYATPIPQTPVRTQATPAYTLRATTPQAAPVHSRVSTPDLSQIPDGEVLINPQNVRYTQDSIAPTFRNGNSLMQTALKIRHGLLNSNDLPSIRVRAHNGVWYALDNRRLWVLKEAGITNVRAWNVTSDPSLEAEFSRKLTSRSGGYSIRVRRGAAAAASVAIPVY